MPPREITRRLGTWERQSIPANQQVEMIRAVPSPQQERTESSWRIESIFAGSGAVSPNRGSTVTAVYVFVTSTNVASLTSNLVAPPFTVTLSDIMNRYPDLDIVAAGLAFTGVSELDFHPFFVNPHENLGIAFEVVNPDAAVASVGNIGYSLAYTMVAQR